MIRLMIWAAIFAAGLWSGAEYTRHDMIERCLAAGGNVGASGLCNGIE